MAELSTFPVQVDTFQTHYDNILEPVAAQGINKIQDAVVAAEQTILTNKQEQTDALVAGLKDVEDRLSSNIQDLDYNVYNLMLQAYYDGKIVPKTALFFDGFSDALKTDVTIKHYLMADVAVGATVLQLNTVVSLVIGQVATLFGKATTEEVIVVGIDPIAITVTLQTGLVNSYSYLEAILVASTVAPSGKVLPAANPFTLKEKIPSTSLVVSEGCVNPQFVPQCVDIKGNMYGIHPQLSAVAPVYVASTGTMSGSVISMVVNGITYNVNDRSPVVADLQGNAWMAWAAYSNTPYGLYLGRIVDGVIVEVIRVQDGTNGGDSYGYHQEGPILLAVDRFGRKHIMCKYVSHGSTSDAYSIYYYQVDSNNSVIIKSVYYPGSAGKPVYGWAMDVDDNGVYAVASGYDKLILWYYPYGGTAIVTTVLASNVDTYSSFKIWGNNGNALVFFVAFTGLCATNEMRRYTVSTIWTLTKTTAVSEISSIPIGVHSGDKVYNMFTYNDGTITHNYMSVTDLTQTTTDWAPILVDMNPGTSSTAFVLDNIMGTDIAHWAIPSTYGVSQTFLLSTLDASTMKATIIRERPYLLTQYQSQFVVTSKELANANMWLTASNLSNVSVKFLFGTSFFAPNVESQTTNLDGSIETLYSIYDQPLTNTLQFRINYTNSFSKIAYSYVNLGGGTLTSGTTTTLKDGDIATGVTFTAYAYFSIGLGTTIKPRKLRFHATAGQVPKQVYVTTSSVSIALASLITTDNDGGWYEILFDSTMNAQSYLTLHCYSGWGAIMGINEIEVYGDSIPTISKYGVAMGV